MSFGHNWNFPHYGNAQIRDSLYEMEREMQRMQAHMRQMEHTFPTPFPPTPMFPPPPPFPQQVLYLTHLFLTTLCRRVRGTNR